MAKLAGTLGVGAFLMWAVNPITLANEPKTLIGQPVLEWTSTQSAAAFGFPNGYNFAHACFTGQLLGGSGLDLPSTITTLAGTKSNVGAVAMRFFFRKRGHMNVSVGKNYFVRVSRLIDIETLATNGFYSWTSYRTSNLSAPINFWKVEIYRGNIPIHSAKVPNYSNTALPQTANSAPALVCGFCHDGTDWRFFVWFSCSLSDSVLFDYTTHFGAGCVFMSEPCEVADVVGNVPTLSTSEGGVVTILSLNERYGPFTKTFTGVPLDPQSLDAAKGREAFSMRQPHANFAVPIKVFGDVPGNYHWFDAGHSFEASLRFTEQNGSVAGTNALFPGCLMLYGKNDQASILPASATGNLHHDNAVNDNLRRLRVRRSSVTMPSGKTVANAEVTVTPVGNVLNCYTGTAFIGQGIAMSAIVGLVRRDKIVADPAVFVGGVENVTSFSQLSIATEYRAIVSTILHEGTSASAVRLPADNWDTSLEDAFFAGAAEMPVGFNQGITAIGPP